MVFQACFSFLRRQCGQTQLEQKQRRHTGRLNLIRETIEDQAKNQSNFKQELKGLLDHQGKTVLSAEQRQCSTSPSGQDALRYADSYA